MKDNDKNITENQDERKPINITVYLASDHEDDVALKKIIETIAINENRTISDCVRLMLWRVATDYAMKNPLVKSIIDREKPPTNNPFGLGI
jgi:hypothetical protein